MEQLSRVMKCISGSADVVVFTIAEYLPVDEHKLHDMLAGVDIFGG